MESTTNISNLTLSFAQERKVWKTAFKWFLKVLKTVGLMEEIALKLEDNNAVIKLPVGENITIVLPEYKSSGCIWQMKGSIPDEVELLFSEYKEVYKSATDGSGKRLLEFITIKPGIVDLKLNYIRHSKGKNSVEHRFKTRLIIE